MTVDGVKLKPFAGLGSWAAFTNAADGAMMMGDTVVFQDEVNPAMDAAFSAGLEVSGLHNHFFFEEPKVFFMHIGGHGNPEKLAAAVKSVWDAVKKVRAGNAQPAAGFGGTAITTSLIEPAPLETIIGAKAQAQDGVAKFTIGRQATMHGVKVGAGMGATTWAAFSGDTKLAAMDGDFMMTSVEVQPVLRSLRQSGINVVALHNHMVGEDPTSYFMHFWGKGPAADLAKAFKAALDLQTEASRKAH